MCDHQHGFALGKLSKGCLHLCFIVRVGKSGGLVKQQDGRIFQHGAGNGNALLLAAGQIHAFCANDGMDALRELFHDIHALCSFQRRQHLGFGGLRSAQPDVVQNAALEQAAVLEHKGDGVHQLFLGDVPHIRSAHPDAAALHIKEPANQVCQCGFAAAGGANESHHLTRLNFQRNALDNIRFAIIAEMHILQGHRGIFRMPRMIVFWHRFRIQNRIHTSQRICHNEFIFAHVHDAGQGQGDYRGNDDVEQQVQQKFRSHTVPGEQKPTYNQESKHTVDCGSIEHHRHPQLFGVGNDPLFVLINGRFEFFERKDGLPEGLDYRDAADILHGLVRH